MPSSVVFRLWPSVLAWIEISVGDSTRNSTCSGKETIAGSTHYVQRLHAINLRDGTDATTPALIGDTTNFNTNNTQIYVYGSGDGNVVDPYNGTLYAAGGYYHDLFQQWNTGDKSGNDGGVYASTDHGKTWALIKNFGSTATSVARRRPSAPIIAM